MKTFTLGQSKEQALSLIPEKEIKLVQLGTNKICISRIGDTFYAFEQHCPHRKASLKEGLVTNFEEIVCPLHEYRFHMKTGEVKSGDCPPLQTYQAILNPSGLEILIP